MIKNLNWAMLPKASKAVFPVIACHADKKGVAFPGEQTIAILAGITEKTARAGIIGLEGFCGFSFDYYLSNRGRRAKKYKVRLPDIDSNEAKFPFYRFILDAGIWRELKPVAKALYPVMRCFSDFDLGLYAMFEELRHCDSEFYEVYPNRKYEFCEAETEILAERAGLHRNSIPVALAELERNFLIETVEEYPGWKVFLQSKDHTSWKREYLNKKIMKSYKHVFQPTKSTGGQAQILPQDAQKGSVP